MYVSSKMTLTKFDDERMRFDEMLPEGKPDLYSQTCDQTNL